ncbi:MAG: CHAD domain-containing protein [Magnetococcales bacterium]|nr:CHAD domain-containing protein [Magnetococcales bacterium]
MPKPHNLPMPIHVSQTVTEAFGLIMRHNFEVMLKWAPIAYDGRDIEGVHQVRVSLRRMRSALVIFRKAIPREILDTWSQEMRWVAGELGPARDLDVFIDEGLGAMTGKIPQAQGEEIAQILVDGEKRLGNLSRKHRDKAYTQVRDMFDSDRYEAFRKGFDAWLKSNAWFDADLPGDYRLKLMKPISSYAIKVLNKRLLRVMRDGSRIDELPIEALHELRIDCKKLRYATEFFKPLFAKKGMDRFIGRLKKLQGVLGTMNDVSVMPDLVEGILEGADSPANHYAGVLIGWRARQYEAIKGKLGAYWEDFANSERPWLAE